MIVGLGSLVFYVLGVICFFLAISGRVKWALCLVIFLAPLRNIIEKIHQFPFGRDFLDILVMAMLVGWVLGAFAGHRKVFDKSLINPAAILLIIYSFLSLWRGYAYLQYYDFFNPLDPRVQDWKNFSMLPILFFLTLNNIHDKKWIERIVMIMCLSIVFVNLYTVRQVMDFSGLVSREKINATFVYLGPNEVAAFYNQISVILLSLYFAMKKGIKKIFLIVLICINVYCVTFLFSRGAYIGLVVGLFILFAMKRPLLLIPLLGILICWQTVLPQEVKERIEMTTNEYGQLDVSAENRILVWQQSMELFKTDPILGVGFGGFRYLGFALKDTHNIYLKILAEQGIIGFFVFIALIFSFFCEGWKLFRRGDDDLARALGLGFSIGVLVLLVNNMFGDRWSYFQLSAFLWVFAGLVARLNAGTQETPAPVQASLRDHAKKLNGRFTK